MPSRVDDNVDGGVHVQVQVDVDVDGEGPYIDAMAVPSTPDASRREQLLSILAELVASGGGPALLGAPIEPAGGAFPDRWRPTRTGVTLLLRRLAWHAALDREVVVAGEPMGAPPTERKPATRVELVRVSRRALVFELGFVGRDDVAGTLAHEIGVAHAALHRMDAAGPYRGVAPGDVAATHAADDPAHELGIDERDLERGSVATVYLGLGVLAANAAFQQYTSSGRTNGAYIPLEYDVIRAGHLTMSELAFLLAVQAVVRGERAAPTGLSPPQRDEVAAWIAALREAPDAVTAETGAGTSGSISASVSAAAQLRERLGVAAEAVPPAVREIVAFADPGDDEAVAVTAFRWRTHRAGTGFLVGSVLGVGLAALAPVRGGISIGIAAASIIGGFGAGRRVRVARCSRCLAQVAPERATCSRCGAALRGDIAHLNDRLEAEEALEEIDPTRQPVQPIDAPEIDSRD